MLTDSLRRAVRDLGHSLARPFAMKWTLATFFSTRQSSKPCASRCCTCSATPPSHGIEAPEERASAGKPSEGVCAFRRRAEATRSASWFPTMARCGLRPHSRPRPPNRRTQRSRGGGPNQGRAGPVLVQARLHHGRDQGCRFRTRRRPGRGPLYRPPFARQRGPGIQLAPGTTFALTVPVSISTIRIVTVLCDGQYFGIPSALIEKTAA